MVFIRGCLRSLKDIMPFYAVARGRTTGVFTTWPECEVQVKGFTGSVYKRFGTNDEAEAFVQTRGGNSGNSALKLPTSLMQLSTATKRSSNESNELMVPQKMSKIDEARTTAFTENIVKMTQYGRHTFMEDRDGFVHVYTDGACENNGKSTAVAGLGVYFGDGHPLNASAPVVGAPTNNRGEIQAATRAITDAAASNVTKLCINSDSHFVIKAITEWIKGWKSRGWRKADGQPVLNETDFRALDRAIQDNPQLKIKWQYVPAHKGIRGNERADELAKRGAQQYKQDRLCGVKML